MSKKIVLEQKVQQKGHEISGELKKLFKEKGIFVVNIIGSPGSGKTSLLEAIAPKLKDIAAVIEGDLETDEDKERIEKAGYPSYQINTKSACRLDAGMVKNAIENFSIDGVKLLFIENVGNLVCPSGIQIGEDIKISVISVTEGADKPAKYPVAIKASTALVITKTDLLPYINCDADRMEKDSLKTNPDIKIFRTSINSGEGMDEFIEWLNEKMTCTN